jgi:NAD(P)-dependent dehydrogenase (short-subunit alcohol dehydrogenase family)
MKSAIVTGASSGIGRATAIRLAAEGYGVLAVARNAGALEEVAASIRSQGGTCTPFPADLTQQDEDGGDVPTQLVAKAVAVFGRLDVVVNAAGIIRGGGIETLDIREGDYMMGINVRVPVTLMQAAAAELTKTRGSIVNVSSVAGPRAFPNLLVYCVSKAALDQATRCAALDLAPKGVRVNAVNPGVVVTELHRRSGMDDESYAKFLAHSRTTHPLGRTGEPEEIAELIAFLASEKSGWITGETIAIDGGRHLTCAR